MAKYPPLNGPCVSIASIEYEEYDGMYLHDLCVCGDITYL